MSPGAIPETSPELIPKSWPIPGAKPHSSWDIFSDIIPLAIKACLIHGHCWAAFMQLAVWNTQRRSVLSQEP